MQYITKANMDIGLQKSLIQESVPFENFYEANNYKVVCIILKSWWEKWCSYVGFNCERNGSYPSIIDNSSIDLSNPKPEEYIYVSKLTWKRLINWYGGGPKFKIFVIKKKPDFQNIKAYISLRPKDLKIIILSLNLKFQQFKNLIEKKFQIDCKNWNFYIENEIDGKRRLNDDSSKLKELGFCDNIVIIGERLRPKYLEINSLDIREEDEEDEALQKALEKSMDDGFIFDKSKEQGFHDEIHEVREFEMIDLNEVCNEDYNSSENYIQVENIKKKVFEAFSSKKYKIKLHSLKSLQKKFTQILQQFSSNNLDL
jgi:DUSP domain